jgi:hypothetical protein
VQPNIYHFVHRLMKHTAAILFLLAVLPSNMALAVTPAVKEFTTGNRTKFSTDAHPKSKGINMVLSYPNSWLAMEGERPNIVQKVVSDGGKGLEMALIITKTIPFPAGTEISESELIEFFTPAEMKGMVPPGATFIHAKPTKIEGLPAGILEYSMRQERAGISIDAQIISYIFIYGTTMVQLQCIVSTGQLTTPAVLARKMDDFKPLFSLIANSIVLRDRWSDQTFTAGVNEGALEEMLKKSAEDINRTAPLMIDKDTRLDSAMFLSSHKFVYLYTLVNYSAEQISWNQFSTKISPRLTNYACSAMPFFMSNNVEVVYRYRSKDGSVLGDILVDPRRCKPAPTKAPSP